MKLLSRIALLFMVVAALVAPMSATAQEQLCFGLSTEDCALMNSTSAAMESVNSFTINYTFNLSVTGAAEVSSDGSGNVTAYPDATDPFKAFAMDMAANGSMNDLAAGTSQSGSIEFRIIDGMFYMTGTGENMGELAGTWLGFTLEKVAAKAMESSGFNFADMFSGEMATGTEDMGDMGAFGDLLTKYITAERSADIQVAGNPVAVFTTKIDLAGLFADPDLSTAATDLAGAVSGMAAAGMGEDMSEEDIESLKTQLPMVLMMVGMLFSDTTVSFTQHVGTSDNYLYGFAFNLDMTLDPTMMAGMTGQSADANAEPVNIKLDLFVELTNHNQSFTFTAPETFTDITEQVLSSMSSGGF